MENQAELIQRRLARERIARKRAEQIIEEKSRDLYIKTQELERTTAAECQARREAEIMLQAFETFTSRLDLDKITGHLQKFLKSLIPHDSGAIYLIDGDIIRLHDIWGDLTDHKVGDEASITPAWIGDVMRASCPILISDTIDDVIARKWEMSADTKTWMAVPMSGQGKYFGCIILESRQSNALSDSAIRLVRALASEAVIALENARLFQEVQKLSTIDPLTGLHNRRHFNAAAQPEFERVVRYDLSLSAIMMDIDHFKRVNDNYGHFIGDRVLVEIAGACMRELRSMDLLARYGGEEFCFLLPETTLSGATSLAERLRKGVAELHFDSRKGNFTVTASFGAAERLPGENSVESLLERSDLAMYEAKNEGRNRVSTWEFTHQSSLPSKNPAPPTAE